MELTAIAAILVFFAFLLVCLKFGQRSANASDEGEISAGVVEGAVFALLSLLLGFSFSATAGRFEAKRTLAVDETNAIGTAIYRLDLLPSKVRADARKEVAEYIQLRLNYLDALEGSGDTASLWKQTTDKQHQIWTTVMRGVPPTGATATQVAVLNPLNDAFDLAQSRDVAFQTHAPAIILVLLGSISCLSAFLAGRLLAKSRAWYRPIYAAAIALTLFTIADLDYPRVGFIRLDYADAPMRAQLDALNHQ